MATDSLFQARSWSDRAGAHHGIGAFVHVPWYEASSARASAVSPSTQPVPRIYPQQLCYSQASAAQPSHRAAKGAHDAQESVYPTKSHRRQRMRGRCRYLRHRRLRGKQLTSAHASLHSSFAQLFVLLRARMDGRVELCIYVDDGEEKEATWGANCSGLVWALAEGGSPIPNN